MRAARVIVRIFMAMALLVWLLFSVKMTGSALSEGMQSGGTRDIIFLSMAALSLVGIAFVFGGFSRNVLVLNLAVAGCGLLSSALAVHIAWTEGVLSVPLALVLVSLPFACGWILAGGFFFLRATREHPSLERPAKKVVDPQD